LRNNHIVSQKSTHFPNLPGNHRSASYGAGAGWVHNRIDSDQCAHNHHTRCAMTTATVPPTPTTAAPTTTTAPPIVFPPSNLNDAQNLANTADMSDVATSRLFSRVWGGAGQLEGRLTCAIRDKLVKAMPLSLQLRQRDLVIQKAGR